MARRTGRYSNCYTVCVNLNETLYETLARRARQYGMKRSAFIRAILENVDDEALYSKILGPLEREGDDIRQRQGIYR